MPTVIGVLLRVTKQHRANTHPYLQAHLRASIMGENPIGETKESYLAAIDKVLERIENPLAAVTDERAAYLQQEKEFYTVLASKIRE